MDTLSPCTPTHRFQREKTTPSNSLPLLQAAWATMASGGSDTSSPSQPSTPPKGSNILTGSDLVKGGDAPILLASDTLGRVGLLRYPAQLPDPPASPQAAKDVASESSQLLILL